MQTQSDTDCNPVSHIRHDGAGKVLMQGDLEPQKEEAADQELDCRKVSPEMVGSIHAWSSTQPMNAQERSSSISIVKLRGRSWSEALNQAQDSEDIVEMLPACRLRGKNALSRFMFSNSLAPSRALWFASMGMPVAGLAVGSMMFHELGFGLVTQLLNVMMSSMSFAKALCTPKGAHKEDWPVYVFLRTLSEKQLEAFYNDIDMVIFLKGRPAAGDKLITSMPGNLILLFGIGVVYESNNVRAVGLFSVWLVILNSPLFLGGLPTSYFMAAVCRSLSESIQSTELWDVHNDGTINLAAAYEGFHGMLQQVDAISTTFQYFFFGAEFLMVLLTIASGFSIWDEMQSPRSTTFKVAFNAAVFFASSCTTLWLLKRTSEVTAAVQKLPYKVHKLCAHIAVTDPAQLAAAERFYAHVEKATSTSGFKCQQLIISPTAILKFVYSALGALATIISLVLTLQKHKFVQQL